ncbi:hypothetical protein [Jiella marina]|uniref:hypothetical protein n=1 Tax=Jiella sp. LLJ827 TaxID=2917712 RepID=UPI002100BAA8|nr:hypothetical protein [Jiella sp. LLJ827]MCQ0989591.1 hypothetical protein [Jiella sp. LLJ827]
MSDDLRSELAKAFDDAVRKHEAKVLKTSQDWRAYRKIEERHTRAREDAERRYRDEYETRVEKARRDIIAEKATPAHEIRPPFGTDEFKKEDIELQAHRRVQKDHEVMLTGIDQAETAEKEALLAEAAERRKLDGQSKDQFAKASDRRSGRDRRIRPSFS